MRLRPREGHELRIESSKLDIFPLAALNWHRDVEGNSVLTARFSDRTRILNVESEIIIQQYDLSPLDFLVEDYAVDYPFVYSEEDSILLSPYLGKDNNPENKLLDEWVGRFWRRGETVPSVTFLLDLTQCIYQSFAYRKRDEEGVQNAEQTLSHGLGSCRDFANFLMIVVRYLGMAARFVSGYIYSNAAPLHSGATHAWVEIFIPGAGWKGFDPTIGDIAGSQHIAVAVARMPESVPPVEGTFLGAPGSSMKVNVTVTEVA